MDRSLDIKILTTGYGESISGHFIAKKGKFGEEKKT